VRPLHSTRRELYRLHNLTNPLAPNLRPLSNVAPTQDVGVIVPEDGGRTYETMRWGLVPFWVKDLEIGSQAINARLERPMPETGTIKKTFGIHSKASGMTTRPPE
jgi:putative SOS response-associated peptidase YedK